MLDFRIYTFLAVCETMNFTHASQKLHITQPAVSQHIHALEEIYCTKLFTQKGKKLFLTDNGNLLLNAMKTINHDITHLKNQIKENDTKYTLNFGATLTVGEYILPNILIEALSKNPNLKINLSVDNTKNLLKQLNVGKIDFAIVEGFFNSVEYDSLVYKNERFFPVCSKDYPSCHIKSLHDLLDKSLFIRELGSGTRDVLETALHERNISISDFSSVKEIGNLNIIKSLVKKNLGISFFYESVVKDELHNGELIKINLNDFDVMHEFNFIWQKDSLFSDYYKQIYELIKIK